MSYSVCLSLCLIPVFIFNYYLFINSLNLILNYLPKYSLLTYDIVSFCVFSPFLSCIN